MATLAPLVKFKFFDDAGEPLVNGKVYTYAAGTSTPQATYADAGGLTANANPTILDARGEAAIWLGTGSYKFVIKDSSDATITTTDNISPPTDALGAVTFSNKTFDNTNTITVKDSLFTMQDNLDTTKQVVFQLSGLSTATTRTMTVPDANGVLATQQAVQSQTVTAFTTGGTSTAFTLTPTPALTALVENQEFDVEFNAAAGATPTLAVSGLTAKSLMYRNSAGTKTAITSAQVPSGWRSRVTYDGTDYIVRELAAGAAATTSAFGIVELATQTEATEFAANVVPTADVLETIFKNMQVFTASGTFTKPTGVTKVYVTVVGAGGNGGAGATGGAASGGGGGGGGGGGTAKGWATINANVPVTVGTTSGATSSFAASGGTLSATGGSTGSAGSGRNGGAGGPGGAGSGGTLGVVGGFGDSGGYADSAATGAGKGGIGGCSSLSGGGSGGLTSSSIGGGGVAGANYGGGGGGGGGGQAGNAGGSGGAGAAGVVIVRW